MQPIANNVWMEITRREDIGADLKAPSAARGGGVTGSYVLVPAVRPDDVVIHYDSRREAIVGVSVATSSAEPAPIYWVARGSYARRAGAQPQWVPGLRVALDRFRELEPPVAMSEIRGHRDELLALRERMQDQARSEEPPPSRRHRIGNTLPLWKPAPHAFICRERMDGDNPT